MFTSHVSPRLAVAMRKQQHAQQCDASARIQVHFGPSSNRMDSKAPQAKANSRIPSQSKAHKRFKHSLQSPCSTTLQPPLQQRPHPGAFPGHQQLCTHCIEAPTGPAASSMGNAIDTSTWKGNSRLLVRGSRLHGFTRTHARHCRSAQLTQTTPATHACRPCSSATNRSKT